MIAIEAIIDWAQNELPDWQSDAVRRILSQDELNDDDKLEILSILKKKYDLVESDQIVPQPLSIKKGNVSGIGQNSAQLIILKSMSNLQGVNAIPCGFCLPFAHEGLTVIYGENASGKSGYARVLKKACNARDTKEQILPNIYSEEESLPAKATLKYSIEGQDKEIAWVNGQKEPTILSNISVFDSKCARVIVDDNNEATYLPYGAHVFKALVSLLKEVRTKLDNEKPKPKELEYRDIDEATEAWKILSQINHSTPLSRIEEFAIWDEEKDEIKLDGLTKAINRAEADNPQKQAQRIRNLKKRINVFIISMSEIDSKISDSSFEGIKKGLEELETTKKALAIASEDIFSNEPLKGIGENAWKLLYNAAKEYSIQFAYPDREFPVIDGDRLCVLCMQPLQENAKDRFKRFKKYMEKNVQEKSDVLNKWYREKEKELKNVKIPTLDDYKDVFDEIGTRSKDTLNQINEYIQSASFRLNKIKACFTEKKVKDITPKKIIPKENLEDIIQKMEAEAVELEKSADPQVLINLKKEKTELKSKKIFCQRKKEIFSYLEDLKKAYKYDLCIKETDFRKITIRGKEIITKALTPQLKQSLNEELTLLNVEHIPLDIKSSGAVGETKHQIQLTSIRSLNKINISEILSEGEQRVVAIAGFLAELKTSQHRCPIVFDDPICSLDHKYRDKIAERLVKEAANRQVIIFTHDIAFLLDLKNKAGEADGIYFYSQTVMKSSVIGECRTGLPWHAMSLKNRIKTLNTKLDEISTLYSDDIETYNKEVAILYGLLRETWEAFVEEVLLFETVKRHGNEIQTQRLKSVSVETQDYKNIHIGIRKCSKWMIGHDKSKSIDVNRPSPEELKEDINKLKKFTKEINKRKDILRKEREASLEPESAEVG